MTRSKLRFFHVAAADDDDATAVGSYRLSDSRPPTRRNGDATTRATSFHHSSCLRRRRLLRRDRDAVYVVSYILAVCLLSLATECDSKAADEETTTARGARIGERRAATVYLPTSATTAGSSTAASVTLKEDDEEMIQPPPPTPARPAVAKRDRRDAANYNEENTRPSEKCRYPRLHERLNEVIARLPEYPGDAGQCGEASVQIANLYDNIYQRECKGDQRSLEGLSAFLIAQFDLKSRCKLEDINLQDITFGALLVCQCSAACRTAAPCSFRQQPGVVVGILILLLVALLPLLPKLLD